MRVAPRTFSDYPWWLRVMFRIQQRHFGQMLTPALVWARIPRLFVCLALFFSALDRKSSPLPAALRSLVTVRVSQINWCEFCVDLNSLSYAQRGGSLVKIRALERWRETEVFDAQERAALEYAEAMSCSDRRVSDELMSRLKALFDDDAIVELTGLIAFQNLSSKFNSALDLPSQGLCRLPHEGS